MAEIVGSLFGVTPEDYQQARQAQADKMALDFAKLDPFQSARFAIGRGAYGLAGALGGALGAQDPQLQLISARNAISKQIDYNDPASIMQGVQSLSQAGDTVGAMQLADVARKLQSEMAQTFQRTAAGRASLAQAAKAAEEEKRIRLSAEQTEQLQSQLNALGPDATEDQILSVLTRYGNPDKVLSALQTKQARLEGQDFRAAQAQTQRDFIAQQAELARKAREEQADLARQAQQQQAQANRDLQLQIAQDRIAASIEAAKERRASAIEIANLQTQGRRELATLAASLKGPKVLAPGLQKEEDKDLEIIDNLTARKETLAPVIQALTPDPKTNKPFLELGPVNNARYRAQNLVGNSTDQSRAFANLERSIQEATNLKTDAAKGVQTDKDVLRFANELIAAFGKNDTKTTLEALTNFNNATEKSQDRIKIRIDSRRKAQNIDPYFGATQRGTAANPIKLD